MLQNVEGAKKEKVVKIPLLYRKYVLVYIYTQGLLDIKARTSVEFLV